MVFSQPIDLPKPDSYKDTTNHYYLTFCEEYYNLFEPYGGYDDFNYDTCRIDFTKYDLKGTKINGEIIWELVTPKKLIKQPYHFLYKYDTINWMPFLFDCVIDDTLAFNKLKIKCGTILNDTFDFNKTALVFNNVWIDCNGSFYYKIQYDSTENTIICNLIKMYGGCRGMKPTDSWITISKPRPDTKIVVKCFWVN